MLGSILVKRSESAKPSGDHLSDRLLPTCYRLVSRLEPTENRFEFCHYSLLPLGCSQRVLHHLCSLATSGSDRRCRHFSASGHHSSHYCTMDGNDLTHWSVVGPTLDFKAGGPMLSLLKLFSFPQ